MLQAFANQMPATNGFEFAAYFQDSMRNRGTRLDFRHQPCVGLNNISGD
jgi:hypothetical protein